MRACYTRLLRQRAASTVADAAPAAASSSSRRASPRLVERQHRALRLSPELHPLNPWPGQRQRLVGTRSSPRRARAACGTAAAAIACACCSSVARRRPTPLVGQPGQVVDPPARRRCGPHGQRLGPGAGVGGRRGPGQPGVAVARASPSCPASQAARVASASRSRSSGASASPHRRARAPGRTTPGPGPGRRDGTPTPGRRAARAGVVGERDAVAAPAARSGQRPPAAAAQASRPPSTASRPAVAEAEHVGFVLRQQPVVDRHPPPGDQLVLVDVQDRGQQVELDPPAQDRRRAEHLAHRRGEVVDLGPDELRHRPGQGHVLPPAAARGRGQQLLEEEGVAAGPAVQLVDRPERRLAALDRGEEVADRRRVEAVEPDVGDGVAPLDPQQRLGRGVAAGQAVGPVGATRYGTGPRAGSTAGNAATPDTATPGSAQCSPGTTSAVRRGSAQLVGRRPHPPSAPPTRTAASRRQGRGAVELHTPSRARHYDSGRPGAPGPPGRRAPACWRRRRPVPDERSSRPRP